MDILQDFPSLSPNVVCLQEARTKEGASSFQGITRWATRVLKKLFLKTGFLEWKARMQKYETIMIDMIRL